MSSNELGLDELIKIVGGTIDDDCDYSDKINYKQILKYFNNAKSLDLDIYHIVGLLSTLAYGSPSDAYNKMLDKVLVTNSAKILKDLDSINLHQEISLGIEKVEFYISIAESKLDFKLLQFIDMERGVPIGSIFKKPCYGISYLLLKFSEICTTDFNQWFLKTSRKDLKVIFTIVKLEEPLKMTPIKSPISFVRTMAIFDEQKNSDMKNIDIEDTDKLYFILYSLQRRFVDLKTDKGRERIDSIINKHKTIIQHLSPDIMREYFSNIDASILVGCVEEVESMDARKKLYISIINYINDNIEKSNVILIEDILNANAYGTMLSKEELKTELEYTVKRFNELINIINKPYMAYRKNKLWCNSVLRITYYLIAIFITKHKGTDKFKHEFIRARKNFKCHLNTQIDEILFQIKP